MASLYDSWSIALSVPVRPYVSDVSSLTEHTSAGGQRLRSLDVLLQRSSHWESIGLKSRLYNRASFPVRLTPYGSTSEGMNGVNGELAPSPVGCAVKITREDIKCIRYTIATRPRRIIAKHSAYFEQFRCPVAWLGASTPFMLQIHGAIDQLLNKKLSYRE